MIARALVPEVGFMKLSKGSSEAHFRKNDKQQIATTKSKKLAIVLFIRSWPRSPHFRVSFNRIE